MDDQNSLGEIKTGRLGLGLAGWTLLGWYLLSQSGQPVGWGSVVRAGGSVVKEEMGMLFELGVVLSDLGLSELGAVRAGGS
ncbi:putative galanin receptor type 1-like [Sesbania bispinosa]|nr:putative galanin receptor type 1-like [Sesbania bispinosa]